MVKDIFPVPVPPNELDVRTVRITEQEGIIENVETVSATYSILENDRFVIVDTACTVTLPTINTGKLITVKSTVAGTVTIDGGDFNIDGAATLDITNQYEVVSFFFSGTEWNALNETRTETQTETQSLIDASFSHSVVFAANHTTTGGGAAEVITVTGALATDIPFTTLQDDGTNDVTIASSVVTEDTLTITFSGDPSSDTIISYQILRAI